MAKLDRKALLVSIQERAARARALAMLLYEKQLSAKQVETLDSVDCELERCRVWLERIAEDTRALRASPDPGLESAGARLAQSSTTTAAPPVCRYETTLTPPAACPCCGCLMVPQASTDSYVCSGRRA